MSLNCFISGCLVESGSVLTWKPHKIEVAATQLSLLNHRTLFLCLFFLLFLYSSFTLHDWPRLGWDSQSYLVGYLNLLIFLPLSPELSILHYHASLSCFPYLVNIIPFPPWLSPLFFPTWGEKCLPFFLIYWYSANGPGAVAFTTKTWLGSCQCWQSSAWHMAQYIQCKCVSQGRHTQSILAGSSTPALRARCSPHVKPSHPERWGFLLGKRECRDANYCPGIVTPLSQYSIA